MHWEDLDLKLSLLLQELLLKLLWDDRELLHKLRPTELQLRMLSEDHELKQKLQQIEQQPKLHLGDQEWKPKSLLIELQLRLPFVDQESKLKLPLNLRWDDLELKQKSKLQESEGYITHIFDSVNFSYLNFSYEENKFIH